MRTDYKAGDIVELLNYKNYNVPSSDTIGYLINQYGMIPQVGHKYYVAFTSNKECGGMSLVCGGPICVDSDHPRTFTVSFHQVCLYKSVDELK